MHSARWISLTAAAVLFCLPVVFGAETNIGGFVRDSAGKPIPAATVAIAGVARDDAGQFLETSLDAVRTDAAGKWSSKVPTLTALTFRLTHPDHKLADYELESPQTWGTNLVRRDQLLSGKAVMIMMPGARIDLVVTTEDGKPVPAAVVHLSKQDERPGPRKTDATGRASVHLPDDHDWKAAIVAKGFAPTLVDINASSAGETLSVKLAAGQVLKAQVLDLQRRPVAGATVALKSWRETSLLDWKTETDSDGWFQWNDAPRDLVRLAISKDGYRDVLNHPAIAGESNPPIALVKMLMVTGIVVDAETKKPIPEFKIYKGNQSTRNGPMRWNRTRPLTGTNGSFTLGLERQRQEDGVLVEAEGYFPVASPAYEEPDTYTNRFELKKGSGLSGVVQWPDHKPASGATVVLVDAATSAYMDHPGEFRNFASRDTPLTISDDQGRFAFPPRLYPHTIFAVHTDGFAEVKVPTLMESGKIVLQPWGPVKGVLRIRDTGETNLIIALHTAQYRYAEEGRTYQPLSVFLKTTPDSNGNFVFEKVPPGARKVHLQYKFFEGSGTTPLSHGVFVDVKAGETADIVIGGTGRTVIGKLTAERQIDWRSDVHRLTLKVPNPDLGRPPPTKGGTPEERERAFAEYEKRSRAFWTSTKGREIERSRLTYIPVFSKDGSFRIPDVPAGRYELVVELREPLARGHRMIGSFKKDVIVPDGSELLDIGTFPLVLIPPRPRLRPSG
jgi:hypothetical protein